MILLFCFVLLGDPPLPKPAIPFAPRQYTCVFTEKGPEIDGKLDDPAWKSARFSELFLDIEGTSKPAPLFDTRMAMVFDNEYLYIAAKLDEPHVWAELTKRDSIVFYDPDFEVFIDPDGDTHEYYELEVNALGTVWDLFLSKPYRDDGAALHDWNLPGLKLATHVNGTINDPSDRDLGWQVEMAIPWEDLKVCANQTVPPGNGDMWRMNFSRVEWRIDTSDGTYRKRLDPATNRPYPEYNWVWSPQGVVNMHYPEMWGFVIFKRGTLPKPTWREGEFAKWALRQVYYALNERLQKGESVEKFEAQMNSIQAPEGYQWPPIIHATPSLYEVILPAKDGSHSWHLGNDGAIWRKAKD